MKTDRHLLEETLSKLRFENIPTYNSRPSSSTGTASLNYVQIDGSKSNLRSDEPIEIAELVTVEPEDDVEVIEEMVEVDEEDLPPNKPDFKINPTTE
jgi:hypothetical protein